MTFINHPIVGEIEIVELRSLAANNKTPYPHTVIVALCDKLLEEEKERKNSTVVSEYGTESFWRK